jgi:hypothetical protein
MIFHILNKKVNKNCYSEATQFIDDGSFYKPVMAYNKNKLLEYCA